ncbi:PREDICTED: uncharacterized protein LOC104743671 [Camelina sativa]|uniref:Uncharacterized protein LOC104743671 n=1 Tax=Camelina sativa TaxID=90675 RepID=A0ABM0VYE3_CAMSA|nr:PREDICTED: uncharacterized protein LOC104743671 [Camelina sativa]
MVKTCNDVHACTKDGFSKVIKSGVLAQLFLNDIRKDPTFKAKAMQDAIEERYTIVATYDQCRTARAKALKMIQEEYDEQFARLHDYMEHLLESNPGSTVEVGTLTDDAGIVRFDRFYVCFEALRKTWLAYCRPIIGIDGCFLKNGVKGQLLAAVGRDANNQFYPVAWAVVQTENFDAWLWFIKKLKVDLKLEDGDGFTLISDRQKGLLNAVDQELPKVEHRICQSFNEAEYNRAIEELKKFDEGVYDAVMQRNPQNCSRAFFGCKSSCEDVSNNFSESYNNAINKAREMPLVDMLETIRRKTMIHIDARLKKAMKRQGRREVAKVLSILCGNGQYEVLENKHGFKVDMNAKICACRRWSMIGIPCRHVLRVILTKKHNPESYVNCDWYLTSTNVKIYSESISAVNGIGFWIRSQEPRIQPPPREVTKVSSVIILEVVQLSELLVEGGRRKKLVKNQAKDKAKKKAKDKAKDKAKNKTKDKAKDLVKAKDQASNLIMINVYEWNEGTE